MSAGELDQSLLDQFGSLGLQEEGGDEAETQGGDTPVSPVLVDERAMGYLVGRVEALRGEMPSQVERDALAVARQVAATVSGKVKAEPDGFTLGRLIKNERAVGDLRAFLLERPQYRDFLDSALFGGNLLHIAAHYGNLAGCQLLVKEFSKSPLSVDMLGRTPIHLAAAKQRLDICEFLIEVCEASGRKAQGEDAPVDLAGLTPVAYSALAINGFSENQVKAREEYEDKRKSVKKRLHILGDACISPSRKPQRVGFQTKTSFGHHLASGWGIKMEDYVVARPYLKESDASMFCVMDGHGGDGCVLKCVEMLSDDGWFNTGDLPIQTKHFFNNRNELIKLAKAVVLKLERDLKTLPQFQLQKIEIQAAMADEPAKYAMKCTDESGTTLVLCFVTSKYVCVASVGDSRAILIPKTPDGQDRPVTRDHKLSSSDAQFVEEEMARIQKYGGFTKNNRVGFDAECKTSLGMTRSIGDFWVKPNVSDSVEEQPVTCTPDVYVFDRSELKGSLIMIASDGIWDVMTEQSAGDFIRSRLNASATPNLEEIAHDVCNKCLELDSQDNMSVLLVDLDDYQAVKPQQTPAPPSALRGPRSTGNQSSLRTRLNFSAISDTSFT